MKKLYLNIQTINERARDIALELYERHGSGTKIYGVPRGGIPVAWAIAASSPSLFVVVNTPEEADVIVDDIVDSGRTRDRFLKEFNKPFYSLFQGDGIIWYVFPWEVSEEASIEDAHIRLDQFYGSSFFNRVTASFAHIFR